MLQVESKQLGEVQPCRMAPQVGRPRDLINKVSRSPFSDFMDPEPQNYSGRSTQVLECSTCFEQNNVGSWLGSYHEKLVQSRQGATV